MKLRLHTGGRLRAWLGRRFGGGPELGERVLRRLLHLAGLAVLAYYALPTNYFVVLPTRIVLLLALFVVLGIELLRLAAGLEMPAMRSYERGRPASYAWYAIALTTVVLVFPPIVATVAVLGVALVDPLIGELRVAGPAWRGTYPLFPIAAYALLATAVLADGGWDPEAIVVGALVASVVGVAVERPKLQLVDDDLAMTLLPAAALYAVWAMSLRF